MILDTLIHESSQDPSYANCMNDWEIWKRADKRRVLSGVLETLHFCTYFRVDVIAIF